MIGFVIGTLCLVGLVKVLRRGRYYAGPYYAFGGGCGGHHDYSGGYGGGGGGYRDPWRRDSWQFDDEPRWQRRGGFGPRFVLRGLFERLQTTPGQEKAIMQALDDLRAAGRGIREEMRGARSEVATAMRGESFDEVALGGATARVEHGIDTMRKAGIDAFAKIHGALDERQRAQLADWLERGPGFGPF
ncbi:periplasmic heavy metal sensor [Pendulispora brunnea]|uniref:Periplasmic heavy metal sensor n=1 Tax=Pendulispora brunnea TaxID=2905690 RepID=A0ABZ2KE45_9BACT